GTGPAPADRGASDTLTFRILRDRRHRGRRTLGGGGVPERPNGTVLKTVEAQASLGSNPSPSATDDGAGSPPPSSRVVASLRARAHVPAQRRRWTDRRGTRGGTWPPPPRPRRRSVPSRSREHG